MEVEDLPDIPDNSNPQTGIFDMDTNSQITTQANPHRDDSQVYYTFWLKRLVYASTTYMPHNS